MDIIVALCIVLFGQLFFGVTQLLRSEAQINKWVEAMTPQIVNQ